MTQMISKAMVLAAGLGRRMRPLTDDRPKPLVPVMGKPLVDYALDRFGRAGVNEAIVNVHYFADMMEAHIAARQTAGTAPACVISDERGELLETGGALVKAEAHLAGAPFFCTNTDAILVDGPAGEPCARLAKAWDEGVMDALLLICPKGAASGYEGVGDFRLDADGRLERRGDAPEAPYVFTGLQILHPRLLNGAPSGPFSTNLLWNKALESGRLYGLAHDGAWMHVGDPAGLMEAERRLGGKNAAVG